MAKGRFKKLICFFLFQDQTISFTITVDTNRPNCEAEAISELCIKEKLNPYSLSFVMDDGQRTYKAEYLTSMLDFQTRSHLIHRKLDSMETVIKKLGREEESLEYTSGLKRRVAIRNMSEEEWIDKHGSGTLRKNKRIGFSYRTQYLAERVAYEFGYGFQLLPRSQITFGDPISEENCHAITESGWHIERYMELDLFGDRVEAKYIHAAFRDNTQREGVGIILRETSAAWLPAGHIVFSIVAEFDPSRKVWKDAINPF